MIDKPHFKDVITYVLLLILFLLVIITLKPIFFPIIYGILLAYIFYPVHYFIKRKIKSDFASALLICLILIIVIIIIASIILGPLIAQIVQLYFFIQHVDFVSIIKEFLPGFLSNTELSNNLVESINTNISKIIGDYLGKASELILNIPRLLINIFVVVFIFFFGLKDGERAVEYVKTLSPLKKENNEKFFKHFKDITNSVLIGKIIVGIIQGLITGIGYLIFGVDNVLLLTIITIIAGIIPILGPWLIWVPVDIYLFSIGNTSAALGLLIYGTLLVGWIDNLIHPIIVSRKVQVNSGIILTGMIGGLLAFGVIGIIIGPLVLSYALLVMELYRQKTMNEEMIFMKEENNSV